MVEIQSVGLFRHGDSGEFKLTTTAAPESPEEVCVLVFVGSDMATVGSHDISTEDLDSSGISERSIDASILRENLMAFYLIGSHAV